MAKAKRVEPKVKPKIVLTLTSKEADALSSLLFMVDFGNPTDSICDALTEVGCDEYRYHTKVVGGTIVIEKA